MPRWPLRLWVIYLAAVGVCSANGIVSCSLSPAPPTVTLTAGCYQQATGTFSNVVDWGAAFGPADGTKTTGSWTASTAGIAITLDGGGNVLERADNTVLAWSAMSNDWTLPQVVAGESMAPPEPYVYVNTFGGHFNAPSSPTSTPVFGDHLVSMVGPGALSVVMSQGFSGVGFALSTAQQLDFIATLSALAPDGTLLGTLTMNVSGLGGFCPGLVLTPPQPCGDAPFVNLRASGAKIGRITISTNDTSGLLIDTLYLDAPGDQVPEPSTAALTTGSLIAGVIIATRRSRRRKKPLQT